jgi:hypothetical protein
MTTSPFPYSFVFPSPGALDLVFCGALKKFKATSVNEFNDDSVNAQIAKLVQADGK